MKAQIAQGGGGIAATGHKAGTDTAIAVLRDGGNAVDAAVAAALVLCVVSPHATSLAGDGFLLIAAPNGQIDGLNGTGAAPGLAQTDLFPNGIDRRGPRAATVPGLVAALGDALTKYGSKTFAELARPAERLALDGFPVYPYLHANIHAQRQALSEDAQARAAYLDDDKPIPIGTTFIQADLGRIMRLLGKNGADDFYRGEVARMVAGAAEHCGALITAEDLARHHSLWQSPVSVPFYGHDVWTMPPNSYGATLLLQLRHLEQAAIARIDPDSADFMAAGIRARRAAYAMAQDVIGDPEFCEDLARQLIAKEISHDKDAISDVPPPSSGCTTNAVIVDKDGMAVSLIESIAMPFGAVTILPGTGIILNNRLGGFNLNGPSLNRLSPYRRPAHTLAPCLVTRNGQLTLSLGTPGTVGQTCTLAQFLTRVLAHGQSMYEAASTPRWSVDFDGKPIVESSLPEAQFNALQKMEPDVRKIADGWISFGSIKTIGLSGSQMTAVADHRRSAYGAAVNPDPH